MAISSANPAALPDRRLTPTAKPAPMRGTNMKIATAPTKITAAMPAVAAKNAPPTTRREPRMRPTPTFWLGACAECLMR